MNKEIELMVNIFKTLDFEFEIMDSNENLIYKTDLYDAIKSLGEKAYYKEKYYDYINKNIEIDDVTYYLNIYSDVTKYQKAIMMLQEDALTTLPNRYALESFLDNRVSDNYITVICDLDDFKNINDTYGHLQGDAVLKQFGIILKRLLSQNIFVGRYGGEEFVMFFRNTDLKTVKRILTGIRYEMTKHEDLYNENYVIKMSCGLYCTSKEDSLNESIKQADLALYYVKNNGKDADAVYNAETDMCYIIE